MIHLFKFLLKKPPLLTNWIFKLLKKECQKHNLNYPVLLQNLIKRKLRLLLKPMKNCHVLWRIEVDLMN
ncbi:unnamed protein product [Trichobilharzia regenti]|nr:unnamed protein product [Trichobilharzia regenti]